MIGTVLQKIVDQLNEVLNGVYGSTTYVKVKNVGKLEDSSSATETKVSVMLLNVEEDKVFKNHITPFTPVVPVNSEETTPPPHVLPLGGTLSMKLNLYVLFAFDPGGSTDGDYADSLSLLTHVLTFFYQRNQMTVSLAADGSNDVKLKVDYHNLSLEDSNNMWSNIGNEQRPFAIYRIQLLDISPPQVLIPAISGVDVTTGHPTIGEDGSPQLINSEQ